MYVKDRYNYTRRQTNKVKIGKELIVGSDTPVVVQTMTDTDTADTEKTLKQIEDVHAAGAQLVRLAVKGKSEAQNFKNIRAQMKKAGVNIPIVADIHFQPKLALELIHSVDKIRINPGNFYDKRATFKKIEFTDKEYAEELATIDDNFKLFLDELRTHDVALRLGANHGSLSDRIMSRYGDKPEGIVESIMEFALICKKHNYKNVVISIKSSNARIMVHSVRLLITRLDKEGIHFPLHLGVTEAGEGLEGRILSSVGIGALLADGIGDTARVSLTEPPQNEVPVTQQIISHYESFADSEHLECSSAEVIDFYNYTRQESQPINTIGGNNPPIVIGSKSVSDCPDAFFSTEYIKHKGDEYLLKSPDEVFSACNHFSTKKIALKISVKYLIQTSDDILKSLSNLNECILLIGSDAINKVGEWRAAFARLSSIDCRLPVILRGRYNGDNENSIAVKAACDMGPIFLDGYGDGIFIECSNPSVDINKIMFTILQASRARISKPEFISCPGCGRTMFNLQNTNLTVKNHFRKLKNIKIAVMGCVVNGPGEMGDADYGYVGAGKGKIHLYKQGSLLLSNISEEDAIIKLEELIKEDDRWEE
ncbi:MAG: (E)-4-hydroxy-3-methylbut-2-enyl-diphosphate synthase [Bacteroidales bacterium]